VGFADASEADVCAFDAEVVLRQNVFQVQDAVSERREVSDSASDQRRFVGEWDGYELIEQRTA
jgi:hypothetical protein